MFTNPKSCSICLKSNSKLVSVSKTDDNNVKWSYKLAFCVPEVRWDDNCAICQCCTVQLDTACSFRNLCLKSSGSQVHLSTWQTHHQNLLEHDEEFKNEINDTVDSNNCKQEIEYTCYLCNKTFTTKPNLIKHIRLHTINRCHLCTKQFTTRTQLQLHNVQAHNETNECRFCAKAFKSTPSLNQHIKRMHQLKERFSEGTVSVCPAPNSNDASEIVDDKLKVEDFKIENFTHYPSNCSTPEDYKSDENYLVLDSDRNESSSGKGNVDHVLTTTTVPVLYDDLQPDFNDMKLQKQKRIKTETKSLGKSNKQVRTRSKFFCEECKSVFLSSKKLLNHALNEHGFDPSLIKPFLCDKCDSKFSTSSNLLQHKKYHMGKRTHICTFCGKGYITKSDLNTHEKQHLNKREYQCAGCPKTFNTNKDLRSHRVVVHTDPSLWNYVCTFCQKRFPIKSNLDQHMRRHTGEKRFGCHICEKRFVDKIVLQKHIKSHSNFRAFKCEHCNKEYKDSKVLEVHLTKVHGIGNAKIPVRVKKYFCHVCPKSYFAKNKLTRHMFSHTGEKPYVCHICERKFTDKSYVKQHLKTTHNVFDVAINK